MGAVKGDTLGMKMVTRAVMKPPIEPAISKP